MTRFDRNRQLGAIAEDLRRIGNTIEKLNAPRSNHLVSAASFADEAAALIREEIAKAPRVENFAR